VADLLAHPPRSLPSRVDIRPSPPSQERLMCRHSTGIATRSRCMRR
jgi:hypothetical protein